MVRALRTIGVTAVAFLSSTASSLSLSSTTSSRQGARWVGPISSSNTYRNTVVMMSATVDRAPTSGGPAVLDRPVIEKEKKSESVKQNKSADDSGWEVRIYNDGNNTREFVSRCLVQVTGLSEMGAYQTMMQAHQHGMAVVGIWIYERAEMYRDALRNNGILCDMVPVGDGQ